MLQPVADTPPLCALVTGPGLFYVDVTRFVFGEGWGAYPASRDFRRSTLFFHDNFKWAGRILIAHQWARRHRCSKLTPATIRLDCARSALSCANASWARCVRAYRMAVPAHRNLWPDVNAR